MMKYYIVCTQPRSGTQFLKSVLHESEAGEPIERFNGVEDALNLDFLYETPHLNICGSSVHRQLFPTKMDFIRKNFGYENITDDYDLLLELYPNCQFIFLHRLNKIKQAISEMKRKITRNSSIPGGVDVSIEDYNFEHIKIFMQVIVHHDTLWLDFFEKYNIQPHFVTYEALCQNPVKEVSNILTFLNLPIPDNLPERLHPDKFSDKIMYNGISEIWYQRAIKDIC